MWRRETGSDLVLSCNCESSATSSSHPHRRLAGARGDGAGEARWEATAMGQRREDNLKKGCGDGAKPGLRLDVTPLGSLS